MSRQNLYEELGLPDSTVMKYKADLAIAIIRSIRARGWTQTQAAQFLGVKQPVVSNIFRGKFREMSSDLLMGYLEELEPTFQAFVIVGPDAQEHPRVATG